jgi:hypothetical protein
MIEIIKNLTSASLLCLVSTSALSDQLIYLDYSDRPNQTVRVTLNSSSELELDLKGDEELIEKNRLRGVTFPFKFSSYKTQKILTKTGNLDPEGSFPFERIFEDAAVYSEDRMGNRIQLPDHVNNMVGLVVKGISNRQGKPRVDSVEGGNLDAQKREAVKSIFASTLLNDTAPSQPLKVGDGYSIEVPFDMPVPGQSPIKVNSKAHYVLKKIEGERAIFDMTMTFRMSKDPGGAQLTANGKGFGMMVYNIKAKLKESEASEMTMEMRLQAGNLVITSKIHDKNSMEQSVIHETPDGPEPNSNERSGVVG